MITEKPISYNFLHLQEKIKAFYVDTQTICLISLMTLTSLMTQSIKTLLHH